MNSQVFISKPDLLSQKTLQSRVKSFIYRQKVKAERDLTPNSEIIKSTDEMPDKSLEFDESTLDITLEDIKMFNKNIQEIKAIQETLRFQVNNKNSYSTSMALRKVAEKHEEIQKISKKFQKTYKKLKLLKASVTENLQILEKKEQLLKNSSNNSFSKNKNLEVDKNFSKKLCTEGLFSENFDYEEAETPGFSKRPKSTISQIELSQLEAGLRQQSFELSKVAEDLRKKEEKITKEANYLQIKHNQLKNREDSIKAAEEALNLKNFELSNKFKKIEKTVNFQYCKNILEDIITNSLIISNDSQQANFRVFQEKIKKDLNEFSVYESRILKDYKKKQKKLEKKEKNLIKEEFRILDQLKLLSQQNHDKIMQNKLEELMKKEEKLKKKQLELLEFKEMLKDREEEWIEKHSNLKFFNKNSKLLNCENRTSDFEKLRESLFCEFNIKQNLEKPNDKDFIRREQEIVEVWKILQEKEQILANKEKEIQKLLSVVSNQYESPNQYSLLDQLLYESQR